MKESSKSKGLSVDGCIAIIGTYLFCLISMLVGDSAESPIVIPLYMAIGFVLAALICLDYYYLKYKRKKKVFGDLSSSAYARMYQEEISCSKIEVCRGYLSEMRFFIKCLKNHTQCITSNNYMTEQNLILFVCDLGYDVFPQMFPLMTNSINDKIKGLIAVSPSCCVGLPNIERAFNNFVQAHTAFDFIIIVDFQILSQKEEFRKEKISTLCRCTREIIINTIATLFQTNNLESIESLLKKSDYLNYFIQSEILTITQRGSIYRIKNRLVVCFGGDRNMGLIAEEIHRMSFERLQSLHVTLSGAWWEGQYNKDVEREIGGELTRPCLSLLTKNRFAGWDQDFDLFSEDVIPHIQPLQTYFNAILDGQKIPHGFSYINDIQ